MRNKPLLSICIPTYNREKELKKSIQSIIKEDIFNTNVIELVISDNNSSDGTEKLCKTFSNYSNIKYNKNTKNLGFDKNISTLIKLAKGNFLWFLSADEYIKKGALDFIINIIKNNIDIAYIGVDKINNTNKLIYLKNGNTLIKEYGISGLGLISRNIFNRKYIPSNLEEYYGNLWIHVSIMFKAILNNSLILTNKELLKVDNSGICHWASGGKVFNTFINLKKIIENNIKIGYDRNIIKNYLNKFVNDFPKTLISAKINGLRYSINNLKTIFIEFYKYPIILILSIIIYIIPNNLFILIKKLTKGK